MSERPSTPGRGLPGRLEAELAKLRQLHSAGSAAEGLPAEAPAAEGLSPERPAGSAKGSIMGILSRARHALAANVNDLLDKADDPAKLIRLMIAEMEATLGEVRASAAKTIADQKEMHRHTLRLGDLQADWAEKAELALSKGREDLARAALIEKRKAAELSDQLKVEIAALDDSLGAYEADIERLQQRLTEARARQRAIAARLESARNQVKLRTLLARERADEARERFDALERRVDDAQGRADALALGDGSGRASLAGEISALLHGDAIEAELGAMKNRQRNAAAGEGEA